MFNKKIGKRTWGTQALPRALCWLMVLAVLAGCSTFGEDQQAQALFDAFSSTRAGGDGTTVTWSGYTKGYQPNGRVPLDITIQNDTATEWQGSFCVLVMDNANNAITSLEKQGFTASPKAGFSKSLSLQLPGILEEDAYHLILVVGRPEDTMVDSVTIYVGASTSPVESIDQQDIDVAIALCQQT